MNFSGISSRTSLGQILRLPLRLIPNNAVLPILQGELRGYKWIAGSSTHGCWLGSYEYEKQHLISSMVQPGTIAFDIGAHVGFYTLLLSKLVGAQGKVVAFEPFPPNLEYLRKHMGINRILNVDVNGAAVAEKQGMIAFRMGAGSSMGQIADEGDIEVEQVSVDGLRAQGKLPTPNYMKIDIEGAEFKALLGAVKTLREAHPTLFLATHGQEVHEQCCNFLRELGYQLRSIDGRDVSDTDEIVATWANKIK